MAEITCDICGKSGARLRRVSRAYGKGKSELLIRGVPVISCSHCGESYRTAETLRTLERIKSDPAHAAVEEMWAGAQLVLATPIGTSDEHGAAEPQSDETADERNRRRCEKNEWPQSRTKIEPRSAPSSAFIRVHPVSLRFL